MWNYFFEVHSAPVRSKITPQILNPDDIRCMQFGIYLRIRKFKSALLKHLIILPRNSSRFTGGQILSSQLNETHSTIECVKSSTFFNPLSIELGLILRKFKLYSIFRQRCKQINPKLFGASNLENIFNLGSVVQFDDEASVTKLIHGGRNQSKYFCFGVESEIRKFDSFPRILVDFITLTLNQQKKIFCS